MSSFAQEYGTSLLWSAIGHVALVLIALLAAVSIPKSAPPTRLAIQATVVDPGAIERRRQAEQQRAREAEQRREAELERQRRQEEARRAAEREAAEKRRKEQDMARAAEAKRRAEAERARAAEAKRREAAAAKAREDKAREEAERKAAAERQRQEAARRAEQARQRAEQAEYERQLAEEEALLVAADSGEMAEYVALIRQRVERSWIRPPSARAGLECEVLVRQIPDGTVVDVRVERCNADDAVRRSIVAAVQKASPLPRPANPALFERNLRFTFKPEE